MALETKETHTVTSTTGGAPSDNDNATPVTPPVTDAPNDPLLTDDQVLDAISGTPVSEEHDEAAAEHTIGLFGPKRPTFAEQYHLTRKGRLHRLAEIFGIARQFDIFHGVTPVKMRLMFEALGPTFVKVGQNLSMRSEILPQEFCDELAKLRADADPIPYETVLDTLAHEYHRPVDQVFESIDRTPLGSASLAQVHRARLVTGEDVAVKVQRPGVRETMAQDIDIMRSVSRRATKYIKSAQIIDLNGVIEELWESFQSETNFLIEARNLVDFREFAKDYKYMDCPKPYINLCTEHVVVMDYVEGISVAHPDQLVAAGYSLEEIGNKLVDNYAAQVLDEGFFHADPHPGNIIIRDGQIVMIDLGMTGRLSARTRSILQDIIFAVGKQDSPALAEAFLRFAGPSDTTEVNYPGLLSDLDAIVQDFGTVSLQDLDIGAFVTALVQLSRKHHVELPGIVTTVARGLVTLEGVLDEFLPDTDMIAIITAHIANTRGLRSAAKEETKTLAIEGQKALHGTLGALAEARTAARMLTRGQLKANVEMVGSEEPIRQLSYMVDRLTMALIVVGLFVGSSIVYYAGMKPVIFGIPVIGFMGYVVAFLLSVWIVIDILRKNRPKKRG
ncbi:AarF/ABC1/UbiB kinase family protein [Bifidobacterium sp. 82T24]|uniref:ABC1 kinase family protein n=1 Tax=Bifidobacterium pluvialisilvae TaxID=2834436 RepID=UPI001C56B076|nr:AarF/UbiB family protein [Bifidobacterium pluvialisilvae]MBW3088312.1 AarF/ABC1/UbiB kinase family protein [Bifidobacterium pluvialisilvae]